MRSSCNFTTIEKKTIETERVIESNENTGMKSMETWSDRTLSIFDRQSIAIL